MIELAAPATGQTAPESIHSRMFAISSAVSRGPDGGMTRPSRPLVIISISRLAAAFPGMITGPE